MIGNSRHKNVGWVFVAAVVVAAFAVPEHAWACDSCWGARVDTPTTRGISMAMMALIGMTSIVWGGIGAFFLHVRRRSRLLEPGELIVTAGGDLLESPEGMEEDDLY